MVADPIHDLADRRGLAGPPREVAIRAVEHVPAHVEHHAGEGAHGPGQESITGAGQGHHHHAQHRDGVGGDAGGDQDPDQGPGDGMQEIAVDRLLDLQGPGMGDDIGLEGGGLGRLARSARPSRS